MKRDPASLRKESCDLLIIGGGIYGAWLAYAATLRGLDAVILEKEDWSSGTSSASSKLIHGGLRYLEYMHVGLVRKSLHERELLQRLAPHRVRPLPLRLPVYRESRRGRLMVGAGLMFYDLLAGITGAGRSFKYHGPEEVGDHFPALRQEGLKGLFVYHDAATHDARLVIEVVAGILANGGRAVNYAEVTGLEPEREGFRVSFTDRLDNTESSIRAKVVVNAAGPWLERFYSSAGGKWRPRYSKGSHLVLPAIPGNALGTLLFSPEDGRVFFILPYDNVTLIGTTDNFYRGDPDKLSVSDEESDYLLRSFRHFFPDADDRVLGRFSGIRVMQNKGADSPSAVTREWLGGEQAPRLFVSLGGKLTGARTDSEALLGKICRKYFPGALPEKTGEIPLPWTPAGDFDSWLGAAVGRGQKAGLGSDVTAAIALRYGSRYDDFLAFLAKTPGGNKPILEGHPYLSGEIAWAKQEEMAVSDLDATRRRMGILIDL